MEDISSILLAILPADLLHLCNRCAEAIGKTMSRSASVILCTEVAYPMY